MQAAQVFAIRNPAMKEGSGARPQKYAQLDRGEHGDLLGTDHAYPHYGVP